MYRQDKWKIYICQYVMTTETEGDESSKRSYMKLVLFHVDSPEDAFSQAEQSISVYRDRYKDDNGDIIFFHCHGIHDICLLQDTWQEIQEESQSGYGYDMEDLHISDLPAPERLVTEKERLSIFL